MYWGTTSNSLTLSTLTSGTFETSRNASIQESADGSIVAQMIGRWEITNTLLGVMDCNKWWEINNWLETNGMFLL